MHDKRAKELPKLTLQFYYFTISSLKRNEMLI